jgi:replicative DNA helicase
VETEKLETTVLAELMIDGEPENYIGNIDKSVFASNRNAEIYGAMRVLVDSGKNIDYPSLASVLPEHDNFLMYLPEHAVSTANIENHIELLKEATERRKLIEAGQLFISELEANTPPPDALAGIFKAAESLNGNKSNKTFKEATMEMVTELERRSKGEHKSGLKTGWLKFDELVHIENGRVYCVAARPSVGKSTFAMLMGVNFAVQGKKVHVYSLELSNYDYESIAKATNQIKNLPITFADSSYATIEEVVFESKKLHAKGELDVIIIDYLQLLKSAGQTSSRYEMITNISGEIKRLARTLNIPIIPVAQLARAGLNRTDKTPQLNDLRDSGAIEQDADTVIMLHRPAMIGEKMPLEYTQVLIRKNRNGQTGEIQMNFNGKYQLFTEA